MTEFKPMTKIDPGELLLETAKNAQHITPELQRLIAKFLDLQTSPVRIIKPVKVQL